MHAKIVRMRSRTTRYRSMTIPTLEGETPHQAMTKGSERESSC